MVEERRDVKERRKEVASFNLIREVLKGEVPSFISTISFARKRKGKKGNKLAYICILS